MDKETFGKECVIRLLFGELRTPAYPDPCDYVRFVDDEGNEVIYWDSEEFREEPREVLGAFIGALARRMDQDRHGR